MPTEDMKGARLCAPFWLLGTLLVLIFFTGGSQRSDISSLQVLRPVSILVGAFGLFTLRRDCWSRYSQIFYLFFAATALVAIHLIPLPPQVWGSLPGRGIFHEIEAFLGAHDQWRPLSMVPAATRNALYALSVPFAVLVLAVQLGPTHHLRLLLLLISLAVLSGAIGLLQAIGLDIEIYPQAEFAGLLANRNHQGVLLTLLFPMLAVAAVWGDMILPRRFTVIAAVALAVIAVPLIIVTGSRAALGVMALAIVMVPMIGLRRQMQVTTRRSRFIAVGGYVLAIATLAILVWMTVVTSRETALVRFQQNQEDIRLPVWRSIVDVLPTYLPWGSGVGSYADVYQILEPDGLLRATFSNHAHNEWLEVALTAGVPGLILLAWAIILFLYTASRLRNVPGFEGAMSRAGLSVILILAFASTVDYPIRTPIMASVFIIAAVWASSFKGFGTDDGRE